VEPRLRCRVEYAEQTRDGRLRAPVFRGLIADDPPAETPSGKVAVRNPDKVFFPDDGVTKADLFEYYRQVAPVLVPHLRGRPFTMLRYPDGIEGKSFFQKDAPDHMPEWIHTFSHEGIRYAMVDDEDSLLWMANMACIDMHPWLARHDRPERPDLVMFDLDPADGVPYSTVVDVALLVRQALNSLGLDGVPKTSGGKGLHILVPVERRHTHEQARGFVSVVAKALRNTYPELVTTAWRRTDRHGVLIDANQNGLGRTTVSAYSIRPRPGALVSAPLRWDEVAEGLDPQTFTMAEVVRRVASYGDLAEPLLKSRQRLPT
jgi:bifunctional non-homologous end joining protein LigD